ncbi:MAG: Lysine decarboxylase family [uncultured Rubrobacteraceae bacterium]|uniref:Cytokinin riboside 5'-monophosphate phosphoribohydrolase n=1 Tax=uncultured Rubrobacteraceae bacterium TaxID=349277 RepID=A0A6J4SIP2_9ACTN|nr:MAG: Lysine decarboxylase family [uncultured Rubrobacteraceae bacterium]
MERVCVFCGSSEGSRPGYVEAAWRMGEELARRGLGLVYGGGKAGLMGAVADAALEAGGKVVGVIPDALVSREIGHEDLTELHVVGSMHERKKMMADLSDGFVALPGGYGTLEEFFEVLSWSQLSIHEKPCALLNVSGYWEPLIALFDRTITEGFVRPDHRSLVMTGEDPGELLDRMKLYTPPSRKRWAVPEDR